MLQRLIEPLRIAFQTFVICGTLIVLAFMVLLSMPRSQLRFFLLETLGWTSAVLAGIYIICPIDVIPDFLPIVGWLDDGGALIGGIAACITALSSRSDRQRWLAEQPRPKVSRALVHHEDGDKKV